MQRRRSRKVSAKAIAAYEWGRAYEERFAHTKGENRTDLGGDVRGNTSHSKHKKRAYKARKKLKKEVTELSLHMDSLRI